MHSDGQTGRNRTQRMIAIFSWPCCLTDYGDGAECLLPHLRFPKISTFITVLHLLSPGVTWCISNESRRIVVVFWGL